MRTGPSPFVAAALIGYAALLALTRALLYARTSDIGFDDESEYLRAGIDFIRSGPPSAEYSPLYALWYWVGSCLVPDPITLYYANWGVLLFATLIGVYASLAAAGVGTTGLVLTVSLMTLLAYFDVWPHVTQLSAVLVLAALTATLRGATLAGGLSAGAVLLAVAAFVRPELVLASAVCVAAVCVASWRQRAIRPIVAPFVAFGLLCAAFGLPIGGGRSALAFSQHYAVNVAMSRHLDIDPWNNYPQIVRADFGDAVTPVGALVANPSAFARHVAANVRNLSRAGSLVMPFFPSEDARRLHPSPVFDLMRQVVGLAVSVLLAIGVWRGSARARRDDQAMRLVVMGAALVMPCLLSALTFAPRAHYFMAPGMAALVLGARGLREARFTPVRSWMLAAVPMTLLVIAAAWSGERAGQPHLDTVRLLRTLDLPARVVLLESDFGRGVYARLDFERLRPTACVPFAACLQLRRPDLIVSDERLRAHYVHDQGYQAFAANPDAQGYDDRPVADTTVRVYVRRAQAEAP